MAIIIKKRATGARARGPALLGPCCNDCHEGIGAAMLAGLNNEKKRIAGLRALDRLALAHQSGELGNLGDIDMSAFVVSSSTITAEVDAFDGRLNAWLLDYAGAAARLPPSFVQQVDDFVARWRKIKDGFYFFQTSRLHDVVNAESEFNRFRDQFLTYGQTTAIAPATVTADGVTVRSDQIPPSSSWVGHLETIAKWGGVLVGGLVLVKVTSDLGLLRRLGGVRTA